MIFSNSKLLTIGIIIILVLLNIYSLFNLKEKQIKINQLYWESEQKAYYSNKGLRIKNKELLTDINGITLVVLFSDSGCYDCLRNEIKNIQKYYEVLKDHIKVCYLGLEKDENYQYYDKRFPTSYIKTNASLFNGYLPVDSPVALLTDPEGNVYEIHKASISNPDRSHEFYKKMNSFFKAFNASRRI